MTNQDSLATILLVSRIGARGTRPLKASEFWALQEGIARPRVLLGQTEQGMVAEHAMSEEMAARIVALLDRDRAMAFELEQLEHTGIRTVTPFDDGYPRRLIDRLGSKAPAVLHAAGVPDLFDQPGLGVVGSRDVSPEGAEVAERVGARGVEVGLSLVSGGARGVDQLAMNSALGAGGTVIGVVADSLVRRLRSRDVRLAIHDERAVMCSPYSPKTPFRVWNAMGRNKLIYALSEVTVVVAAESQRGGTWSGATEALKQDFGRVAVWRGPGEGSGNAELERLGAGPLASVDQLETVLPHGNDQAGADGHGPDPPRPSATQGSLFPAARASPRPRRMRVREW